MVLGLPTHGWVYCHSLPRAFALAQNFEQLVYSRLALSIVGCGFVIGIRMVAEWFNPRDRLEASMAAGATLICDRCLDSPSIAAATAFLAAGQINWRLAIALTGIVAAVYGVFISSASKTPSSGKVYERSASGQGLEVTTSKRLVYAPDEYSLDWDFGCDCLALK